MTSDPTLIWDTNCYTYILGKLSSRDCLRLGTRLASDNRSPTLSSVNLLEIYATPSSERRTALLEVVQALTRPVLLCPPEHLILQSLASSTPGLSPPQVDVVDQSKWGRDYRDLHSQGLLHQLKLEVNLELLRVYKKANSFIHAYVTRGLPDGVSLPPVPKQSTIDGGEWLHFYTTAAKQLRHLPLDRDTTDFLDRAKEAVLQWYLVAASTPFNGPILELWRILGIEDPEERSRFAMQNWGNLDQHAIPAMFWSITVHQAQHSYDNGNFLDMLQLPYLLLPNSYLFTNDSTLHAIGERFPTPKRRSQFLYFRDWIRPLVA